MRHIHVISILLLGLTYQPAAEARRGRFVQVYDGHGREMLTRTYVKRLNRHIERRGFLSRLGWRNGNRKQERPGSLAKMARKLTRARAKTYTGGLATAVTAVAVPVAAAAVAVHGGRKLKHKLKYRFSRRYRRQIQFQRKFHNDLVRLEAAFRKAFPDAVPNPRGPQLKQGEQGRRTLNRHTQINTRAVERSSYDQRRPAPPDRDSRSRSNSSPGRPRFRLGAVSDGNLGQRSENQDRMTAIPTGNGGTLMVVADGAGGVKGGRAAADKTVSAMEGYFRRHKQVGNEAVALKQSIKSANSAVYGHLEGKSTVVALWVGKKGQARIAHAGDSRAYLMRNGKLTLLTRDHTQLQELRDRGKSERELKAMGDAYYRWDSTLVNYIGKKDINVALSSRLQLKKGDRILLCSDGLSGYVGDREIAQRLGQRKPAQSVAQDLVRLAKDRKSTDNITVQIYEHQG